MFLCLRSFGGQERRTESAVSVDLEITQCARQVLHVKRFVTIVRRQRRTTAPNHLRRRLLEGLLRGGLCLC